MSKLDFSRGEISPLMRYRSDLEVYHKGLETLKNFLPTPQGGLTRRYGTQIIGALPSTEPNPAVRTFNLGSTGLAAVIPAPGSDLTVTIDNSTYDTEDRIEDIPKNTEIQILLVFSESNTISAYWLNTSTGIPSYIQQLWNYDSGYERPTLGFDDTRDVRVVQIESSVYIVASGHVYELYWDITKPADTSLEWDDSTEYELGDVVYYTSGSTYWLECITAHDSSLLDLATETDCDLFWKVVYPPYLSWRRVTPRVGEKLLTGSAYQDDFDEYAWVENTTWVNSTAYKLGDVVKYDNSGTDEWHECIVEHTSCAAPGVFTDDSAYWDEMNAISTLETDPPEDDIIYRVRAYAGREQTIPREVVSHQGRLIMASSSRFPATIFGSEIGRYTKYGAGINDDDPWIYTISGDRVGKILWLYVTDRLYLGTRGGIYGVTGLITPSQFMLTKINAHAASEVEGVTASGNLLYFQSDRRTLREVSYVDQQDNAQAVDLTIFSTHLFEEHLARKMVVQNSPHTIIWILRGDGKLVSFSYEQTVGMMAFAVHELEGDVIDISGGVGDDLYAILQRSSDTVLIRMGSTLLADGVNSSSLFYLDGLKKFVIRDTLADFEAYIQNYDFRTWLIANSIDSIDDVQVEEGPLDVSSQSIDGYIKHCALRHFSSLASIDLSDNNLSNWASIPIPTSWETIDFSDNSLTVADVNQILIDLQTSNDLSARTGSIDLSGNAEAGYDGLVAAVALHDAGWTVTLENTAGWEDGYTLTFDANSGTGSPPTAMSPLGGETVEIPDENTLVRTGYEFVGWNTNAGGTGTPYSEGEDYVMPGENTTLYAMWARVYTVTYNANGGTGSVPSTVSYQAGKTVTVSINNLTKLYHTDDGWNTAANGSGTDHAEGTTFQMPGNDVVLYSKWESIAYEIGDTGPAGGIIFYKSGSIRLECAPVSTETRKAWGVTYLVGGTSEDVLEGADNTDLIVAADGSGDYAAQFCYGLSEGGFSDWFLPSLDELILMYENLYLDGKGSLSGDDYYWASSESAVKKYASILSFIDGYENHIYKSRVFSVRAVRQFTIA